MDHFFHRLGGKSALSGLRMMQNMCKFTIPLGAISTDVCNPADLSVMEDKGEMTLRPGYDS